MKENNQTMTATDVVQRFKDACNELAEAVNKQLFEGCRTWYWVADVVGGVCDFGDSDFLAPGDMVCIIENNLTYSEYKEWRDANIDHGFFINLKSWLRGERHGMFEKTK